MRLALTIAISGSRPQDYPRRWASSRVHCIGWLAGFSSSPPFSVLHREQRCTKARGELVRERELVHDHPGNSTNHSLGRWLVIDLRCTHHLVSQPSVRMRLNSRFGGVVAEILRDFVSTVTKLFRIRVH